MQITAPNPNQVFSLINDLDYDCFLQVVEQLNGDVCGVLRLASTCQVLLSKINSIKIPLYKICLKSIEKEQAKRVAERMSQMHAIRCHAPHWPHASIIVEEMRKVQMKRDEDEKHLRETCIEKSQPLVQRKQKLSAQLAIEIQKEAQ